MPTHEDCRRRVCLICMCKSKVMCTITDAIYIGIQEHVVDGLDRNDERLPVVLCGTCYMAVCEMRKGIFGRKLEIFDHSKIATSRVTRSVSTMALQQCTCIVYEVAKSVPSNLNKAAGGKAMKTKKKRGRPSMDVLPSASKNKPAEDTLYLCSICLSSVRRGLDHCCTKSKRIQNINDLANIGTPKTKEKVASALVRRKLAETQIVTSTPSATVTLASSLGRPLVLFANGSLRKKLRFTAEDVSTIQTDMHLSNKQTLQLASHIRTVAACRTAVQPHLKQILHRHNHRLDMLFSIEENKFLFKEEKNKWEERPAVFCNDLQLLISKVEETRNKSYSFVKIGLDGGGGFFKVCLTLHNVSDNKHMAKRQTYADGVAAKKMADTGVQKLFIIGMVPDIPENYENVISVWSKLLIEGIHQKYTVATDLKLANIMIGLMSHTSLHPCTWCDVEKDRLEQCGQLRSIHTITEKFWSWKNSEGRHRHSYRFWFSHI